MQRVFVHRMVWYWSVPKNTKTYYIVRTYATVHMLCCVLKSWTYVKFFITSSPSHRAPLAPLLLCCLSSHRRLPSTCASASHCTASHRAPLVPLVWLVVMSLLIMPPPPVHPRLRLSSPPSLSHCLSSHRHLSSTSASASHRTAATIKYSSTVSHV